jgi:hypothetical protein
VVVYPVMFVLLDKYRGCLLRDSTVPNSGGTVYIIIFLLFHIF